MGENGLYLQQIAWKRNLYQWQWKIVSNICMPMLAATCVLPNNNSISKQFLNPDHTINLLLSFLQLLLPPPPIKYAYIHWLLVLVLVLDINFYLLSSLYGSNNSPSTDYSQSYRMSLVSPTRSPLHHHTHHHRPLPRLRHRGLLWNFLEIHCLEKSWVLHVTFNFMYPQIYIYTNS